MAKEKTNLERMKALQAVGIQVNKHYGGDVVRRIVLDCDRVSTGSLALDYALGCNSKGIGGIPVGHTSCFVGWESAGKTTAALRTAGNFQRACARCFMPANSPGVEAALDESGDPIVEPIGLDEHGVMQYAPVYTVTGRCDCYKAGRWTPEKPEFTGKVSEKKEQEEAWTKYLSDLTENSFVPCVVVFVDQENTLDLKWAQRAGCNVMVYDEVMKLWCRVMQFVHVVPSSAEQAIDLVAHYIANGADYIIVDSIPALVPQVEREASASDDQRAQQARMINKALRRWVGDSSEIKTKEGRPITMTVIQGWRSGMGAFAERVMPGGNGQKFAYSIIADLRTAEKEEKSEALMSHGNKSQKMTGVVHLRQFFEIRKNKTWPPNKKGSHVLQLVDDGDEKAGQIMEIPYLYETATVFGLVEKAGSKYKFRGQEFGSQTAVMGYIASNPAVKRWLDRELRLALYASVNEEFMK